MKRIWKISMLAYSASFLIVSALFLGLFSSNVFGNIVKLQAIYAISILLSFVITSFLIARKLILPILIINDKISKIEITNFNSKIRIKINDDDIKILINNINRLLSQAYLSMDYSKNFSSKIAHEVKTPLTILRLKLEKYADKIRPDISEELQNEVFKLTNYVDRIILINQLEKGLIQLNKESFDIELLLKQIVDDFKILASDQNKSINLKSEPAFVFADVFYIKQILLNLLSNSIKHGKGDIHIRLKKSKNTLGILFYNYKMIFSENYFNLGFGVKLVKALCTAHNNINVIIHNGKKWYGVLLEFTLQH
ncbi:MAG: hypothetical protein N2490_07135 [Ignavibacteria bacterium]|nr:hypothetical protein [Ignavibacteria bacterium]